MAEDFQPLLANRLEPLLNNLAFVHADRDAAVRAWLDFEGTLLRPHGVEFSSRVVQGSLEHVVHQLEPLSMPTRERYLFIPCRNDWTLVLDNGAIGSDVHSLLYGSAFRTNCRGVRVCVSIAGGVVPNRQRVLSTMLEVYAPPYDENELARAIRSLAVLKEGSWVWDESGTPFPFEDTSSYGAKRIRDRFTPEMLKRYALAMGIDAFNEQFYLTNDPGAVLLQLSHVPFPNQTRRSLEDVQRERRALED